jgi:hypothetical protein
MQREFHCLSPLGFSRYEISEDGRIRNKETNFITRGSKESQGFYRVNLSADNGKATRLYMHRLLLLYFKGNPPTSKHRAVHIDGDREYNNICNLHWALE